MSSPVVYIREGVDPYLVGLIPYWLENLPKEESVISRLDKFYQHGGEWFPFEGHVLGEDYSLQYPGDPAHIPLAKIVVPDHDEVVYMYDHSWVAVVWPDRHFEVCRMD